MSPSCTYSGRELCRKRVRRGDDENASSGDKTGKSVEECEWSVQTTQQVCRQHTVKLPDVERQTARVTALETDPASILTQTR